MDEETVKAICEIGNRLAEEATKAYNDFLEALKKAVDVLGDICEDILKAIDIQCGTSRKWRKMEATKIRPLFLDKRSKIHRCRNAI